ncbi:hypothetical protein [Halobaculum marinum]|uniref:DUF3244 domain-containing protein n=1 Tax=Halobaculum marinum TaxID=3031996 RepID=A0ABD5WTQ5_9EURY|nr:hypothetical protein [Halobaculum sp. DT55]
MEQQRTCLVVVCCVIVISGCAGVGGQDPTTTAHSADWRLTIEDNYPNAFSVVVVEESSNKELSTKTFDSTDHGTLNVSSAIPADRVVVVEIHSGNQTLWEERMAPSVSYELTIREDGEVEALLYEV